MVQNDHAEAVRALGDELAAHETGNSLSSEASLQIREDAMVHDDTIVWEPGGTEAETSAGTARRYRKPLKSLCWCDLKGLSVDTVNVVQA